MAPICFVSNFLKVNMQNNLNFIVSSRESSPEAIQEALTAREAIKQINDLLVIMENNNSASTPITKPIKEY
ncbi:hypothetical protein SPFL3102_02309 [Sporomusaceae bacterium FL31]|nr:hypothetical protein SPFL3101_02275 [Sporomusaceae bacterium FL31]GCE34497.1 hypothetical protein SPFL3102_02309 [Sporomusaceae bacterium]